MSENGCFVHLVRLHFDRMLLGVGIFFLGVGLEGRHDLLFELFGFLLITECVGEGGCPLREGRDDQGQPLLDRRSLGRRRRRRRYGSRGPAAAAALLRVDVLVGVVPEKKCRVKTAARMNKDKIVSNLSLAFFWDTTLEHYWA